MSVTEKEAETAIVEAKKLGEFITESLAQAINRHAKRTDAPSGRLLTIRKRR